MFNFNSDADSLTLEPDSTIVPQTQNVSSNTDAVSSKQAGGTTTKEGGDPSAQKNVVTGGNELLKLVIPAAKKGEEDRYAIVPFPETYEDAQQVAIEVLGYCMIDPTLQDIRLRCATHSKKNQWVWADIRPKDWKIASRASGEVGIFQTIRPKAETPYSFDRGYLRLTAGKPMGGNMNWTKVTKLEKKLSSLIDRPRTCAEAVKNVKIIAQSDWGIAGQFYRHPSDSMDDLNENTLKFYTFHSNEYTNVWNEFPPSAHIDEAVWQHFLPPPGGILGVTLVT